MRLCATERDFGRERARPVGGVAAGVLGESTLANACERVWLHLPDAQQIEPEAQARHRVLLVALTGGRVVAGRSRRSGRAGVWTQEQQSVRRHVTRRRTTRHFDLRHEYTRIRIQILLKKYMQQRKHRTQLQGTRIQSSGAANSIAQGHVLHMSS